MKGPFVIFLLCVVELVTLHALKTTKEESYRQGFFDGYRRGGATAAGSPSPWRQMKPGKDGECVHTLTDGTFAWTKCALLDEVK